MRKLVKLALLPMLVLGGVLAQLPAVLAADYVIVVDHMKFGELPAQLQVGDTITWRNDDIFRHSATARDKSFDVDLPAKAEAVMTVQTAGNVDFFCKFHPGMKGTLVIAP
ncbi:MAG TPA: amicyanin [Devosia sp.]|nr:amicyanin [Devosia sp.]